MALVTYPFSFNLRMVSFTRLESLDRLDRPVLTDLMFNSCSYFVFMYIIALRALYHYILRP